MPTGGEQVAGLLDQIQAGRKGAADELFEWLYPELKRLAAARIRAFHERQLPADASWTEHSPATTGEICPRAFASCSTMCF